jgi:hypothetical protein
MTSFFQLPLCGFIFQTKISVRSFQLNVSFFAVCGYSIQTFFAALYTNLFLRTRGPKVLQDEEIGWLSDAKVCVKVSKRFKAPLAHNSSRVYLSRTSKSIDCESKIYVFVLFVLIGKESVIPKSILWFKIWKKKKCCFVLLCRRKKRKGLMQLF